MAAAPGACHSCRLAHLKLTGHVCFTSPRAGGTSTGAQGWNRFHADAYLCPGSAGAAGGSSSSGASVGGSGAGGPGYVLSATVQLGPLSWVRGFVSFLQGCGSSQWKLCRWGEGPGAPC